MAELSNENPLKSSPSFELKINRKYKKQNPKQTKKLLEDFLPELEKQFPGRDKQSGTMKLRTGKWFKVIDYKSLGKPDIERAITELKTLGLVQPKSWLLGLAETEYHEFVPKSQESGLKEEGDIRG